MTANYLISDFQKSLLARLSAMDRTTTDFFVVPPVVVDCRGDADTFRARLTERQQDFVVDEYAKDKRRSVGGLARPAYLYAREKIKEYFRPLDRDGVSQLGQILRDWRREADRQPGQRSKYELDPRNYHSGIEFIMPVSGLRFEADLYGR